MLHATAIPFDPEPGDPLTKRTLAVFFGTLGLLLRAGVTVVAEAAFQNQVWRSNLERLHDLAHIKVVQCWVDSSVALQRMNDRQFRPAHADESVIADKDYFGKFVRLSLPVPTMDVDTTGGYEPTLDEIVAFLNGR